MTRRVERRNDSATGQRATLKVSNDACLLGICDSTVIPLIEPVAVVLRHGSSERRTSGYDKSFRLTCRMRTSGLSHSRHSRYASSTWIYGKFWQAEFGPGMTARLAFGVDN